MAFCVAKEVWKEYLFEISWIPDYEYRTINGKGLQKLTNGLGGQFGTKGGGYF